MRRPSPALAEMVKGAQADRKLVISGFHDPVGDPVKNAALAQRRALAVQQGEGFRAPLVNSMRPLIDDDQQNFEYLVRMISL
jgi:hypothetical protein